MFDVSLSDKPRVAPLREINAQGEWTDSSRYDLNQEKRQNVCVFAQSLINRQGSCPGELKRMLGNQSRICSGPCPSVCVCVRGGSPAVLLSCLMVLSFHNTELLKNAVNANALLLARSHTLIHSVCLFYLCNCLSSFLVMVSAYCELNICIRLWYVWFFDHLHSCLYGW